MSEGQSRRLEVDGIAHGLLDPQDRTVDLLLRRPARRRSAPSGTASPIRSRSSTSARWRRATDVLIYHTGDEKAVVGHRPGREGAPYPDPEAGRSEAGGGGPRGREAARQAGDARRRSRPTPPSPTWRWCGRPRLSVMPVPAAHWKRLLADGSLSATEQSPKPVIFRAMPSTAFRSRRPVRARRRPAQGHRRADRRARARRQVPDAARRHRVGQDDDAGARASPTTASRRWSCPTTRRSRPSSTASCGSSCRRNAVEYFVSYYDYYQPEAYVPSTDVYIEKDASINEDIEVAAAPRHLEPDGAGGRGHRRHGERDLRPGRSGGVPAADGHGATGEIAGPRRHPRRAGARSSTGGTTSPSSRAPSGCAATRSRSSRPTTSRRSGSSSGATRSSGSARSIRSPATPSRSSTSAPSIRPSTSSPSAPRSSAR